MINHVYILTSNLLIIQLVVSVARKSFMYNLELSKSVEANVNEINVQLNEQFSSIAPKC